MSDESKPRLFLRGQQMYRLKAEVPTNEKKAHVCGSAFDKDAWQQQSRDDLCRDILSETPPRRIGLVCDAGLGKSTNMEWVQAHLARPGSRQLPLLLRLEDDLELLLAERKPGVPSEALVRRLAQLIQDQAGGDTERHIMAIRRLQAVGRITLLIDGLDHAPAPRRLAIKLKEMLASEQWRQCPVWISGRPTAFTSCWSKLFSDPEWEFVRIQELAEPEVRFYLSRQGGGDWYTELTAARPLLAIPRFLQLVSGILKAAVAGIDSLDGRVEKVRELKLNTPADVYYRAFFHVGDMNVGDLDLGDLDDPDSQGLLTQGLRGHAAWIGLNKSRGEEPLWNNVGRRVERTAALVGAIAFAMLDRKTSSGQAHPQFTAVRLDPLQKSVSRRLQAASQGTHAAFERDFALLRDMNNHLLDFLLFSKANETHLAFHDRTTQAFFAAYWACRWARSRELNATRKWVVDDLFENKQEFREFWQFAAEMPDEALPRDEDGVVKEGRWRALFRPLYDGSVVDDRGLSVRSTEFIYRSWPRMEASKAGQQIIVEAYRTQFIPEELLAGLIPLMDSGKPQDAGTFKMGEGDGARPMTVTPYYLHRYCVTNVEFEMFDPRHRERRWFRGKHPAVEKTGDVTADDSCPVVMVSWYDAWCFAQWLGTFERAGEIHEFTLPDEVQWEYACRAGRETPFTFDEQHDGLSCTADVCNFDGNYPDGEGAKKGEYRECTLPVDGKVSDVWSALGITGINGPNRWGLCQMHGNVWEWCLEFFDARASDRVLRGGSWLDYGRVCRSAHRIRDAPDDRDHFGGFRLAAVPVGAKQVE